MPLKLLSPLVVIVGVGIAGVALYVGFTETFTSSNAGTFPTSVARPGLIGQTPVPPPLRQKPNVASAVMEESRVLQATVSLAQQTGGVVTPGSASARLSAAGQLADLRGVAVASDYPVWVVTLSGAFYPSHPGPPGIGGADTYTTATYYFDGYSGDELTLKLSGLSQQAQATVTPIPARDAPVIDAAAATRAANAQLGDIGALSAELKTFGDVAGEVDLPRFADAYPIWVLTANTTLKNAPAVITVYVDAYSGAVLDVTKEFAPTATP